MRRVAEIIYVVPEQREEYLKTHLNPSEKVSQILWIHGIRNQFYFALNDLLLMSFEYEGKDFYKDMAAIAAYPEMKDYLVQTRAVTSRQISRCPPTGGRRLRGWEAR